VIFNHNSSLQLETDLRMFKVVHVIEEVHRVCNLDLEPYAMLISLKRALIKDLQPSDLTDHKYYLEGEKKEVLRRSVCTRGTRKRLLKDIVAWAEESSSGTIYWLFGPAGAGKSTIASTIARRFELVTSDDPIVLGGNFMCSRLFEETRSATRIVRTIVYQLALKCKPFADALTHSGKFDTINQSPRDQLEGLLIEPWQASESARLANSSTRPPQYLIVIDALDEIDGAGGPEFLRDLLGVINENRVKGLKFFATSRPEPALVSHVDNFGDKQLYRLEEVPIEEAHGDIKVFLSASLPTASLEIIEKVVTLADGLFIYAATILKYLDGCEPDEKVELLVELLSKLSSENPRTSAETSLLDELYRQVLRDVFSKFQSAIRPRRLQLLHTFLCTVERTSTSTVANLCTSTNTSSYEKGAEDVLKKLHAVLYSKNGQVLWYHKSFPDFLFNRDRSEEFWCNQVEHHQRLTDSCFRVMKERLRFNICNIKSSFIFDRDNLTLSDAIRDNISSTLSYSCRNWDRHLSSTLPSTSGSVHKALLEFVKLRAIFWIEAMNLLESCGLCDPMLRTASKWVTNVSSTLPEYFMMHLIYLHRPTLH